MVLFWQTLKKNFSFLASSISERIRISVSYIFNNWHIWFCWPIYHLLHENNNCSFESWMIVLPRISIVSLETSLCIREQNQWYISRFWVKWLRNELPGKSALPWETVLKIGNPSVSTGTPLANFMNSSLIQTDRVESFEFLCLLISSCPKNSMTEFY